MPTLLLGRGEGQPELLLQGSGKETAHRVPLPTHSARDFVDGRALGSLQHCDHPSKQDAGRFVSDGWSGSGKASIADHS
jgi:hypothetical protein